MGKYLAIDVGSTSIQIVIGNKEEFVTRQGSFLTEENWSEDGIVRLVKQYLEDNEYSEEDISAIGIGIPGLIDIEEKEMIYSSQMEELGFEKLEEELETPVYIENDANTAVLGEKRYGIKSEVENIVTIVLGTGVGGGIYYNGKLLRSQKQGRSPEPGFMMVDDYTWHDYCGGGNIPEHVERCLENETRDTELTANIDAEDLFKIAEKDEVAKEYVRELQEVNAKALGTVANLYCPEIITVTGSVALENPDFMRRSFEEAEEYIVGETPKMTRSNLGEQTGLYGALALAQEQHQ